MNERNKDSPRIRVRRDVAVLADPTTGVSIPAFEHGSGEEGDEIGETPKGVSVSDRCHPV